MANNSKAPHGGAGVLTVPPAQGEHTHSQPIKKKGFWFLLFGVLLPIAAMLVESNFHLLAENFFDPFPSPAHLVLFALIPFSNFLLWLAGRRDMSQYYGFMALASGMAMGVGILYSVMCLPLAPVFCFYSLACGFGLLGLAPLLSIPCSFAAGKTVTGLAHARGTYFDAHQVEHIGHLIVLVMVVAVELPSTLTRINLSEAVSHKAQPEFAAADQAANSPRPLAFATDLATEPEKLKAIQWLRRFGNREVLLRACYEHSGKATDILGSLYESGHPIPVQAAREVYYKVTGKPFNTEPIPASFRATIKHNGALSPTDPLTGGVDDEFDLDNGIAGENVSGMARGLAMNAANLSGKVDAEEALAQLTFSFDFENTSKYDREARAQILLPPGGVVSRANLTVNGFSRDAVIVSRSLARQQYQAAVQEKRDPLLVSYSGIDKVLVQCFPVAPGETMKVTLDIAAPLTILDKQKAVLELPRFSERNFAVKGELALELVSDGEIKLDGLHAITPKLTSNGGFSVAGEVAVAPPSTVVAVDSVGQDSVEDKIDGPTVGTGSAQAVEQVNEPAATPMPMPISMPISLPPSRAGSMLGAPEVQGCAPMPTNYKSRLLGALDWSTLAADGLMQVGRSGNVGSIWCEAGPLLDGYRVVGDIAPETYAPIKKLAVIIDGSSSMAAALPSIVEGLKGAPKDIELSISLVGDTPRTWPAPGSMVSSGGAKEKLTSIEYMRAGDGSFNSALQELAAATAVGGQDNSKVVADMLSQSRSPDCAVLWIHGPQPLAATAAGLQRELAFANGARLFDMQVVPGPNAGLDGLGNSNIFRVKRVGTKQTDIGLFFLAASRENSRQTPKPQFRLELPGADGKFAAIGGQRQVSKDLLKVMAAYEMRRQISGQESQFGGHSPASLGTAFGIVGPQTSAIVVSNESHSYLPPKQSAISARQILLALGLGYKTAMEYTLLEMHPSRVLDLDGRDAALYQTGSDSGSTWLPNPAESVDRYFKGVVGEMNSLSTAAGAPTAPAAPAAPFSEPNRNLVWPSAPAKKFNEYKDFSQVREQKADLPMSDAFGSGPIKEESPFEGDQAAQVYGLAGGAASDGKEVLSLDGSVVQQPALADKPSSSFPTLQRATNGTIAAGNSIVSRSAANLEVLGAVNTAGTINNRFMGFGYSSDSGSGRHFYGPGAKERMIQESGIFYSCMALFATLSVWLCLRAGLSIKRKRRSS
ncbi:MAG: hypothetical protein K2Y32_08805 [Candidatus Obscuribacterales bacterium]|nr:hypothetical protein [Candidatus Obscuribacterales bacterium]